MSLGQYQNEASADSHSYMINSGGSPSLYDGTSSESSASSPLNSNGFDNIYGGNNFITYPAFPMQYPTTGDYAAAMGLIPVELDIEGLYEDHDRRRRKNGSEKVVASHVHSRRRAQNRASQRAFRDRKEKHMRELEQRLGELEGRHNDLTQSYETLQVEYASVKQELDTLRKENNRLESSSSGSTKSYPSSDKAWDDPKGELLDPLLFDVSDFCYDQEDAKDNKE